MKFSKIIVLLAAVALLFAGCKEDNWMDWKVENELWLVQNLQSDPEVHQTESGLQYKIIHQGNTTDAKPHSTTTVYVDYQGWLINGYRFDYGTYSAMSLSQVVEGFAEGMKKIYPGGDIMLYIPSDLAYGEDGSGSEGATSFIPPYSTLIFEIHLCAIAN